MQSSVSCALTCGAHPAHSIAALMLQAPPDSMRIFMACQYICSYPGGDSVDPADHWPDSITWRGQEHGELSHLDTLKQDPHVQFQHQSACHRCMYMTGSVALHIVHCIVSRHRASQIVIWGCYHPSVSVASPGIMTTRSHGNPTWLLQLQRRSS